MGLALVGFVTWQAIFVPFDFGIADRTRMLRGWSTLTAEVRELKTLIRRRVVDNCAADAGEDDVLDLD